jgi:hypothetical protein
MVMINIILEIYGYMKAVYDYILNFGNEKIINLHVRLLSLLIE